MALAIPWTTIGKVIIAIATVGLWQQLVWVVMLFAIAMIIAVGLAPAAERGRRGAPGCGRGQ
jgi:hypothetical protein